VDRDLIFALAALFLSVTSWSWQGIDWHRQRKARAISSAIAAGREPAERELLALKGADMAVQALETALNASYATNERLRKRIAELESENKDGAR